MQSCAPYAAMPASSRGRVYPEAESAYRSPYQRDRDRIVHCSAFRRLEYKTQVFVNHEGDMFRTRLTHSLEVAQIGRTVARALELNEDLTEAIGLAHDLGHTPFGHAGQDALDDCMREYGGFEHNLQSLRVVEQLEEKYAEFPGLNLTYESREGILKHCARDRAAELGMVAQRFIDGSQPGLEAQIANIADEVAYNNHDVDDGLRAGLLDIKSLCEVDLFGQAYDEVNRRWPGLENRRLIHEVIRWMIDALVSDLIETSRERIAAADPGDIEAVRAAGRPLIALSETMRGQNLILKRFLREYLYLDYRVQRMAYRAGRIIRTLFEIYCERPVLLPRPVRERVQARAASRGEAARRRVVADYIAGMTDRFAIAEYQRLVDPVQSIS